MENNRQGIPIPFKECSHCLKNYEFVVDFWEFEDDNECLYCSQGDPIPEKFIKLEYITLEDLDTNILPKRIQDCFSHIDDKDEQINEVEPQTEDNTTEKKSKKHKKKPKDK